MASPGQLCDVVAELLGLSRPTVRAHDLNLAKSGLRTSGGHGRSAAKMTPRDAANLLIVSIAAPTIKDTVLTYERFNTLWSFLSNLSIRQSGLMVGNSETLGREWDLRFLPIKSLSDLDEDHKFPDALAAIIQAATLQEMRLAEHETGNTHRIIAREKARTVSIEVSLFLPDCRANITLSTDTFVESRMYHSKNEEEFHFVSGDKSSNLSARFQFTDRTIWAIAKRLRDETIEPIDWKK